MTDGVADKNIKLVTDRVAFWASSLDAMLQAFVSAVNAGDKLGTIVSSARLAQLGGCLGGEYEAICNGFIDSDTEGKVASQQAEMVVRMVEKNGEDLVPSGLAPGESPDRGLS